MLTGLLNLKHSNTKGRPVQYMITKEPERLITLLWIVYLHQEYKQKVLNIDLQR